jgi:hypothetical protein
MMRLSAVAALFAAVTLMMGAPWAWHPASRVLVDAPDTHLAMWTLAWDAHALVTNPFAIFDANIFHPATNTLAYSENLIGSAILAAPVIWLTGDLALAVNLVALVSSVLCGLGAYVLARTLGSSRGAGIVAGLIFLFAPSRFFRMSQLHLVAVQWVPFGLACLHRYFERGRARHARLAIVFLVAQVLTSGHGAVFLALSMALLTLVHIATGRALNATGRASTTERPRSENAGPKPDATRQVRPGASLAGDIGVTGLLLLVPAVLVWLPYRRAQAEVGLRRSLENWAVTPESFIASPTLVHQGILSWITDARVNDTASAYLFPGYLPVVLAACALVPLGRSRARDRRVWFYAALAVVSVLLFAPPPIGIWPLVYWLPVFNFIRVPSRFVILTTLALGVLAAYGFDRLTWNGTVARRAVACAVVSALLLAEFSAHPFEGVPYRFDVPAIDRWLATQPRPFVVAELPTPGPRQAGAFERHQTAAMLHSTVHWQPTIHGYSGIRSPRLDEASEVLRRFPDEPSIQVLADLGVTHVVVHTELYAQEELPAVNAALADHPRLRLLRTEGTGRAYALSH